jgi:threonine dehydrogenase-like Zn-dependent dehydrogenase
VGEVVEGPEELVGRTVFCLYPHQDLYCVPARAVVRLPEGLPPERAVLAANAETALNGFWDAQPSEGGRIVVIGAGVVGLLTAWLCEELGGSEVLVVDIDPGRADAAQSLGLTFTTGSPAGMDVELVIHASASEDGLRTALETAGVEGTIVELSWYGARDVSLPLGEAFHSRRLTLRSSQVGRIPPAKAAEWTHRSRMEKALELLLDDRLDALITGESAFDDLPAVMEKLSRTSAGTLCHRIRYP